jgi:GcrA cell cycle regulator
MNAVVRPWSEAEDELARTLWFEGKSASEIARRLPSPRSRNAVIGRLNRMKAPRRAAPHARLKEPGSAHSVLDRHRAKRLKAMAKAPALIALPPENAVPLAALSAGACSFPHGEPGQPGFGFCGAPRERGAYCAAHAALCYTPLTKRQKRAGERLALWLDQRARKMAATQ